MTGVREWNTSKALRWTPNLVEGYCEALST